MAWNDGRIAMVSVEAAIFIVLAGAYSEQVNLDVFLQGYSDEPISVERIGREPIRVKHASLAITLAVPLSLMFPKAGIVTFADEFVAVGNLYSFFPALN